MKTIVDRACTNDVCVLVASQGDATQAEQQSREEKDQCAVSFFWSWKRQSMRVTWWPCKGVRWRQGSKANKRKTCVQCHFCGLVSDSLCVCLGGLARECGVGRKRVPGSAVYACLRSWWRQGSKTDRGRRNSGDVDAFIMDLC